ncbi:hypothetical protein [Noviherbaspirillum autotrophicum]|uniref:hypothetical protein n=1 Tax=Noviherbaspirillum autotrophicum TaxID=709839 RepID=UPI0012FDB127|nr:hypothetical protein [Noviherbaspirillum autotrophicum]
MAGALNFQEKILEYGNIEKLHGRPFFVQEAGKNVFAPVEGNRAKTAHMME